MRKIKICFVFILLIAVAVCIGVWFRIFLSRSTPSHNNITLPVDKLIERLEDDINLDDHLNEIHVKYYISTYNRSMIEYLIDHVDRGMVMTIYPDQQEEHEFFRIKPYDDIHLYEFSGGTHVRGSRTIEHILAESYPSDFLICTILHEKLWHYSNAENQPHKLVLIMRLIDKKEKWHWDWRTPDIVYKDIKAYLRIYSSYENWPTLRRRVYRNIYRYTSRWIIREPDWRIRVGNGWILSKDRDELLRITDDKGYEAAISFLHKLLGREEMKRETDTLSENHMD